MQCAKTHELCGLRSQDVVIVIWLSSASAARCCKVDLHRVFLLVVVQGGVKLAALTLAHCLSPESGLHAASFHDPCMPGMGCTVFG